VSDEQAAACWRASSAFVTASEHEGFLVPLVESMAFERPIVARAFGAVPETLGDAGVLLGPADGPAVLAEAMAEVVVDQQLREQLICKSRVRRQRFDVDRARRAFLGHLLEVV
jgi:glycosyltransferase involved in cell wall biosynthesis